MDQNIKTGNKGFTLVEILIAIVIIGIITTGVRPAYQSIVKRAKESSLKKNLYTLRDAIDMYSVDHRDENNLPMYPNSLIDMVEEKYIRYIPEDPMTGNENWITIPFDSGGIYDVRSSSDEVGTNEKPYSRW